jgi:hypothetical protein
VEKQRELARLRLELLARYPTDEAHVLPTAFGNVLRAFEVYPREVYGADAIPVWLRLAAVVPKDHAAQVNGARAQVDCFVNIAFLAFGLVLAALVGAAVHTIGAAMDDGAAAAAGDPPWVRQAVAAAVAFAVSLLSYRWAVARAAAWGEAVKAAFDCYLPALIGQLGYAVPPTEAERRAFWEQFNDRMLYRYPMPREWPVAGKAGGKASPERPPDGAEDDAARDGGRAEEDGSDEDGKDAGPSEGRRDAGGDGAAAADTGTLPGASPVATRSS